MKMLFAVILRFLFHVCANRHQKQINWISCLSLLDQLLLIRDTFTTAFVKNLIVVLVWLTLSYINGTLVVTFFRHQVNTHARAHTHTEQLICHILLFILSFIIINPKHVINMIFWFTGPAAPTEHTRHTHVWTDKCLFSAYLQEITLNNLKMSL